MFGVIEDGIDVFDVAIDEEDIFDNLAPWSYSPDSRLTAEYRKYSRSDFLSSLEQTVLWEMDVVNKKVGITKKFWWEHYIGKVKDKSVLDVGCGTKLSRSLLALLWQRCVRFRYFQVLPKSFATEFKKNRYSGRKRLVGCS